jgi:hypothetical protein
MEVILMAATSITGLSGDNGGIGSAAGLCKGTDRMSLSVDKLIGPRIVAAGAIALISGARTVELPVDLFDAVSSYIVFAKDATTAANSSSGSVNATTGVLTLAGTGTDVVNYIIVKAGV